MIVNYNRAGVWIIQYGKMVDAPKDADGKSIQEKVFVGEGIKLVPGLNTIRDAVWADISKYPDVAEALENGLLSIVEDKAPANAKKKEAPENETIEDLSKYDVKKAVSVVDGQMEKEVLVQWRKKEKRPTVLKAIKDQIEKVAQADSAFDNKE
jgi:hypothetical protein